jgi:branched-chain amino acid transport system ATP-binding protein
MRRHSRGGAALALFGRDLNHHCVQGPLQMRRSKPRGIAERQVVQGVICENQTSMFSNFQSMIFLLPATQTSNVSNIRGYRGFAIKSNSPRAQRNRERQLRDDAAAIIEKVGLRDRMNAEADSLSCGELWLLKLAVALGAGPQLLMLDEPAAGLNTEEAHQLGGVLRTLIGNGVEAILLVEHNMALVMEVSHRIVVLNFGRKIAEGAPDEVRKDSGVIESYLGKPVA